MFYIRGVFRILAWGGKKFCAQRKKKKFKCSAKKIARNTNFFLSFAPPQKKLNLPPKKITFAPPKMNFLPLLK